MNHIKELIYQLFALSGHWPQRACAFRGKTNERRNKKDDRKIVKKHGTRLRLMNEKK